MVYIGKNLLPMLEVLTLTGQNEHGELEWIGNDKAWELVELWQTYNLINHVITHSTSLAE